MHHFQRSAIVAMFLAGIAQCANAQETVPQATVEQSGRYELKAQGDGFVRLDKQTGEMSFCTVSGKNLSCLIGAQEREAYENELALLRERMDAIEKQVSGISADASSEAKKQDRISGLTPESGAPALPKETPVPPAEESLDRTQKELDRAMDLAGKAMQRFFEVIRDLRAEMEKG